MDHLTEFAATTLAGAVGSFVAVLVVGASLLLVVPVALGIGAVALLVLRGRAARPDGPTPDRSSRVGSGQAR